MEVENLKLKQDIDMIKAENLETKQTMTTMNEAIAVNTDKITWKKKVVDLEHDGVATIPEITNAQEIYIQALYNNDKVNYATMTIVNNGLNGYYNMKAHYWLEDYALSVSINWEKGTIRNCVDKCNIVLIAYR